MNTVKGIVLGLGLYLMIAVVARYTGFNKLVMLIWAVSAVIAYGIAKNTEDRSEKKKGVLVLAGIALLSTAIVYFLGVVGIYLDSWL